MYKYTYRLISNYNPVLVHYAHYSSIVYKNDVLLNITGASIGRAAISNLDEANVRSDDTNKISYERMVLFCEKSIENSQKRANDYHCLETSK